MKKSNLYCSRAFLLTAVCSYSLMANSAMSTEEAYDKLSNTSIKQCKEVGIVLNKQNLNTFLHMIPASKIVKIVNSISKVLNIRYLGIFLSNIKLDYLHIPIIDYEQHIKEVSNGGKDKKFNSFRRYRT